MQHVMQSDLLLKRLTITKRERSQRLRERETICMSRSAKWGKKLRETFLFTKLIFHL